LKGDLLLIVGMPSMREYRVGRDFFVREFVDNEVAVELALQEAHREGRSLVKGVTRGAYQLPSVLHNRHIDKDKIA
jgi:hypothetical protein